ncbi:MULTISPECIES: DUF1049 domain-containing protein [Spirulina]|uniref:DUF1049 domain-containing protein n=2 Tax=Spirulinaceae TaxID=1890448 RepID=UPI00232F2CAD|nr:MULTISPECIES: DUF1049 domain-containing protein [Spirulina]
MMRAIANLLTAILIGAWLIAVATLSIQNVTPLAIRFLNLQSVEIPFGVLLTFAVVVGLVVGMVLPIFSSRSPR